MNIRFEKKQTKQRHKWNIEKMKTFCSDFIDNKDKILEQQQKEIFATFNTKELYKDFYVGTTQIKYFDYYTRKNLLQIFEEMQQNVNISANKDIIQIVIIETE
jgi:hypothetical protein